MGKLRYTAITSLDGYIADEQGSFDWAQPDDAVHSFVNDLEAEVGMYLYGRRMYEVMRYWETAPTGEDQPAYLADYARIWQAADKIVFSRTLETVSSARTSIARELDPDAIRELKQDGDLTVDGPGLAGAALAAGLVDEIGPIVVPVVVGGGTRFLPDGVRLDLELVEERRFDSGAVHLRYRTR